MIVYNFFKNVILNIKYTRILKKIYRDENLIQNLSSLFGTNFKIDRAGRIYSIINPNIKDGKYDPDSQIFEYDETGLNNKSYIEKWVMERMNVAANFIHANNLFELLTYSIDRIDEYDNYLFKIYPITWEDMINSTKKFSILILILVIITTVTFTLIKFI